jgi:V/A-type H+-transporting ATPase subunit E
MSKLADILQQEALAEIDEIRAEAEARAEKITREAEKEASERVAAYRKRTAGEIRAGTQRAQSAAELTLATARIQAKGRVIALVRDKVLAALEEIAGKPHYGDVLAALAEEAMAALETAEAVVVHPDDRDKLSDWARRQGLELRTDAALHLGVRIVAREGRRSAENSLPERLERAWETLAAEVAGLLWE